jgi:nitroimidazol reductase NimA-like FMN-containing flavoprotein (pyridoxamine 5'-phosphate oxidase superfamily)
LPAVLPVNYRVIGDNIVFRTGTGTKLDAATQNAVVAFEVDHIDRTWHGGWSVVVTGVARQVTDPAEMQELETTPVARWVQGDDDHAVAISLDLMSGRRIVAGPKSARR